MKESVQGLMGTEVQNKTSNNAEVCPLVAVKGTADTDYDTSVSVFDALKIKNQTLALVVMSKQ